MRAAWLAEERDTSTLHATLVGSGSVLDDGETADSPRARAQAGPLAAVAFHDLVERYNSLHGAEAAEYFPFPKQLAAYRAVYEAYQPPEERHLMNHKGHMMFLRPEETHIDGAVIRAMTLTGTRAELVERLQGIRDAGYSQLAVSLPPGQEDSMLERWCEVFASL
jgi:5,10-methylenetetrahydromethanopterin reductase